MELTQSDFPKLLTYLESITNKNKRIALFVEGHRILIGYFPNHATLADLSKQLPPKIIEKIRKKFAMSEFVIMSGFVKLDPISGKKMIFTAISGKDQESLKNIE